MIKPDGVEKGLIGEIIVVEQRDLKVVALEMSSQQPSKMDHSPKRREADSPHWWQNPWYLRKFNIDPIKALGTKDNLEIGKMVRKWLVDYIVLAPLVRMVVEGVHAVDMVRKIVQPHHALPG